MTKKASKTPVRRALREDSALQPSVADGLRAVKNAHRDYFDEGVRRDFADSLDLDAATRKDRNQENRWDYLLGHAPSGEVVAVEPHKGRQGDITTVIQKRTAALEHLQGHLRDGARVSTWLWVASGKVHFADTENARYRLAQNGIEFVGTNVTAKHLPAESSRSSPPAAKPRRKTKAKR